MTNSDAILITSSFGGGWMIPKTAIATEVLADYFGGEPTFWEPVQEEGWLVEPNEIEFLAEHANEAGLRVSVN